MKLVPINAPRDAQRLLCCHCHEMKPANTMQADIEGKPFVAYYCKQCAEEITKGK